MKIDSAHIQFHADHLSLRREESRESLRAWRGAAPGTATGTGTSATSRVSISDQARRPAPVPESSPGAAESSAIAEAVDAAENDPMLRLIRSMIEMLTGEPVRVMRAATGDADAPAVRPAKASPPPVERRSAAPDFGIEYDFHALREEVEQTRVSAEGVIRTADGREIRFQLDLEMHRQFREETRVSLRAGNAVRKDPLVLNFDGRAAELTDQRVHFDLDGDGRRENLALLGGGSAYLTLDRNHNGRVDSGRELFGPATDSGFGELAALDADGNGWIDAADPAFALLRLWTPAADGDGRLETLADRGIGALAVAHVASPFELRGSGNRDLGAITATGLYLREDGGLGTVQEIDLTV